MSLEWTGDVKTPAIVRRTYLRLLHFVNDDDIRARDKEYDAQMRMECAWMADEIQTLEAKR